ncbi:UNVERIFIED_CONTAM: hypothetical protein K2H54_019097 [Gekko kuhli]
MHKALPEKEDRSLVVTPPALAVGLPGWSPENPHLLLMLLLLQWKILPVFLLVDPVIGSSPPIDHEAKIEAGLLQQVMRTPPSSRSTGQLRTYQEQEGCRGYIASNVETSLLACTGSDIIMPVTSG